MLRRLSALAKAEVADKILPWLCVFIPLNLVPTEHGYKGLVHQPDTSIRLQV